MIYFDQAATSLLKPPAVAAAVARAIGTFGNPSRGAYAASLTANRTVYEARVLLARLFNCPRPEQVAFAANATMAINTALKGIVSAGDHVVTTALEHNSVLRPLYELCQSRNCSLTILSAQQALQKGLPALAATVQGNTKAFVCTHASNVTGDLVDIRAAGAICHRHGLYFLLDAAQTAGVFPIDMEKDRIDIVCFTGHKSLFGPQGTGGLCVREGLSVAPLITGGTGSQTFSPEAPAVMPEHLEAGTINAHGIAGLRAGLQYIEQLGLPELRCRQQRLMRRFYEGVAALPQISIYGDFSQAERAAVVSLNIGAYDSGQVSDALSEEFGICTRAGGHCAPLLHKALGTMQQGAVRFSFSHFNTEAEIDAAVCAIKSLARQ